MIWLFVVLAAAGVFVIAAVTVGRESFRLGHRLQTTVLDLEEAVTQVAEGIPPEAQARLSYDDVRALIQTHLDYMQDRGVLGVGSEDPAVTRVNGGETDDVVVADSDALAFTLGQVDEAGVEVRDEDAYAVISALHRYLSAIGAIGPSTEA